MLSKLIMCVGLILRLLFGSIEVNDWNTIISSASSVVVYTNGEQLCIGKEDKNFGAIVDGFLAMIDGGHDMPAFGVSLDTETRVAMKTGMWLEFMYNRAYEHNGMPFESLLLELNSDYSGFNLIRKANGKYEGRCFYISLVDKDMSKMCLLIDSICARD
jgi:hypothetical protein